MENRIYNFNPGPAMQPLEVLQEAQAEFLNFAKSGMSIIEISHRSKQYEQVHNQAKADIKELMGEKAGVTFFAAEARDPFVFSGDMKTYGSILSLEEEKDRERSKKDYMINLKSELEIRTLHEKIDHFIMDQQQELLELQKTQIELMNDILKKVEK